MLRKNLSFVLLLLFLFPQINKVVHSYHHDSEEHCMEMSMTHFCEREHTCAICDFNTPVSTSPIEQDFDIVFVANVTSHPKFINNALPFVFDFNFSPRAPPVA